MFNAVRLQYDLDFFIIISKSIYFRKKGFR